MPKIKFIGLADVVSFSREDLERVGVDDQDAIRFSSENDFTIDVTEKAAQFLTKDDPDFVTEEEAENRKKASKKKGKDVPASEPSEPNGEASASGTSVGDGSVTTVGGSTAGANG